MKISWDPEEKDFLLIEIGDMAFPILTTECRLLIFTGIILGSIIGLLILFGIIGKSK